MQNNENKSIAEHLQLTLDLADQFLQSTDQDANQAILRAIGTVAQIIFITVPDERHEDAIAEATDKLRNYLKLLDAVNGMSQPSH